jgi:hypothetical protein
MAGEVTLARFDDFSRGHHGLIDPTKAPAGSWSGHDVMLYSSGLIGPRLGLLAGPTLPSGRTGYVGIEYLQNDPFDATWNDGLWAVVYDADTAPDGLFLYYSEAGTAAWTLAGTTGAVGTVTDATTLAAPATFVQGINNYLTYVNVNGAIYKFDVRTPSTDPVAVTNPPPYDVASMVKYRDWLVAADIENQTNRIYFTTLGTGGSDFDDWPDVNYYDVGDSFPITSLITTTNGLLVGKATGWWLVSGVLGDRAVIRQISSGYGPANYNAAKVRSDNSVAVLSPDGTPGIFNGYTTTWFPEHRIPDFAVAGGVIATASSRRTIFTGSGVDPDDGVTYELAYVRNDDTGTWEHWRFASSLDFRSGAPTYVGASRIPDTTYSVGLIAAGTAVHTLRYDTARPGLGTTFEKDSNGSDSDTLGQGDLGATPIEGEVWLTSKSERDQRMIQVHKVRVNLKRWAMETSTHGIRNNVCRVKLRTFDSVAGKIETDWQEMQWEEPDTSEHPVMEQVDFTFRAPQYAASFQIGLQLIGVAVRDVTVYGVIKEGKE